MTGYLTAIKIVACAACIAAASYRIGINSERVAWQTRESEQLRAANAKIMEAQDAARAAERAHADAMAAVSTNYQRRLNDASKQAAADRDAVRAGTIRLRDPNSPAGLRACGNFAAEASPTAPGRDDRATGELSAEATEFLLDLAADADQIALQLQACQSIVRADRGDTGADR